MTRAAKPPTRERAERQALRRRVRAWFAAFNHSHWERCFALIDPKLTETRRVDSSVYSRSLADFKRAYGTIHLWHVRISLHMGGAAAQRDPRPFAYVYIVWQDDAHGYHMFRERWVNHEGQWYSRVAGLVVNRQIATSEST